MYLPTTTAIKQRVTFTEDSLSAAHSTQYFMSVISFNLPNNDYKAGSTPIPCLEAGKLIHREVRWPAHGCLTNWWRGGFRPCWLAQSMFPESPLCTGYTLGMVIIPPSVALNCLCVPECPGRLVNIQGAVPECLIEWVWDEYRKSAFLTTSQVLVVWERTLSATGLFLP